VALNAIRPPYRLGLMALAAISLLAGVWAGLIRLGWVRTTFDASLALAHGPLMVTGVLGVVIGLERAVALGQGWAYGAPLMAGVGGLALIIGLPVMLVAGLFASSLLLVAIFVRIYRLRPEWASAALMVGAATWLVGNGLWLIGRSIVELVPWWAAFLVLTIAGERLELAQVLLPVRVRLALVGVIGLILAGLLVSLTRFVPGVQIAGVGFVARAIWLIRISRCVLV
jgi:hypothetical protein